MVMPAVIEVTFQDGSSRRMTLAAESWIKSTSVSVKLDSTEPVTAVTVDPDHVLPDKDRANNVWKAAPSP
jgi:hypothetical protein